MRALLMLLAAALLLTAAAVGQEQDSALLEAQALIDDGNPEEAIGVLDRSLKKRPRDAKALFLRSTARIMTGDMSGGRLDLERSLEIDPGRRQGWLNRAALDLAESRHEQALQAFLEAEALDPAAEDNALNIGAVLLLSGDRDGASQRFRQYLQARTDDPNAFYLVAANYAISDRGDLAIPLLQKAIALDETYRLRARRDGNFSTLAENGAFQTLLNTDSYRIPGDAHVARTTIDLPFTGRTSRVLDATLTALQLARAPMLRGVEVTPEWALIWSDLRIKLASKDKAGTEIILSAPRGRFSDEAWLARSEDLLRQITLQLHSRRPGAVQTPVPRQP